MLRWEKFCIDVLWMFCLKFCLDRKAMRRVKDLKDGKSGVIGGCGCAELVKIAGNCAKLNRHTLMARDC
jgi:hypothetical protein